MDLEELRLAETWEYIQGGLLFLDESGEALALADAELKRYINSLSSLQPKAAALISRLKLTEAEQPFETVPESLKRMTEQDIAYLKEDPAVLDESYGSMAMAAFYNRVSQYLKIPSGIPAAMRAYIREQVARELPDIQILS